MPIESDIRNFCNTRLGTDINPTSDVSAVSPGVIYAMRNIFGIGLPAGAVRAPDTFQPEQAVAEVRHVAHRIATSPQDLEAVATMYSVTSEVAKECLEGISRNFSRADVEKDLQLFLAGIQFGHETFKSSPQKTLLKGFGDAPFYCVPEVFYDEVYLLKPTPAEYDCIAYPIPPLLYSAIARKLGDKNKTMRTIFDNGVEEVIHHNQYTDTARRQRLIAETRAIYEPVYGATWAAHAFLTEMQLSHHHKNPVTRAEIAARVAESHARQPFEQDARVVRQAHLGDMDRRFDKVMQLIERGAEGI